MKLEITVLDRRILVQQVLSNGKYGKTEEYLSPSFKRAYPAAYAVLCIAEGSVSDWYYGVKDTIPFHFLKEGIFVIEMNGNEAVIKEAEEVPIPFRNPSGNGMGRIIAYSQKAYDYYSQLIWPNGRKAYAVYKGWI